MSHGMSKFNAVSDTNDVKHGVKIAEDLRDWYLHLKGIGDHPSDRQRIPSFAEVIERVSRAEAKLSAALERVRELEFGDCCMEKGCSGECTCSICAPDLAIRDLTVERDDALERVRELTLEREDTDGWLMKHPRPSPFHADESAKHYIYALEDRIRWLNVGISCSRLDRSGMKLRAESAEAERDAALARIRELERLGRDSVAATDCQGECDDSIPETCPHRALKAALESTPEAK